MTLYDSIYMKFECKKHSSVMTDVKRNLWVVVLPPGKGQRGRAGGWITLNRPPGGVRDYKLCSNLKRKIRESTEQCV